MFNTYLKAWSLKADGAPIIRHSSRLLPVRLASGKPAMLKIALEAQEQRGGQVMRCWHGEGAARVYACDSNALLMERAQDSASLLDMALSGSDADASRIICAVIARLHTAPVPPWSGLVVPLAYWFRALVPAAQVYGGILPFCATTAQELLADQHNTVLLHGDMHHNNVLNFGTARGWLATDPKGLAGERGFEYAALLCNPELATATCPQRFMQQLSVVTQASGLRRERLLQWTLAYAGLSAAWFLEDEDPTSAASGLAIAEMALTALRYST
ncbi:aminoglycoside phosphotransferase family protein [Saezia sanguinis]|uniref:aminoglycoside phosphotransferase family protein n=1 Tax=Saezia sanguinis TaxID=1965230 RepID=UPI003029C8B9